jgi:plastocyanin
MRRALTLVAGAAAVALPAAAPAAAQAPHEQGHAVTAPAAPLLGAPPVAMADKVFAPGAVTALVGDPVTWVNDDRIAHDVATLDGSYDSGRMEPGARAQHVFTAQGDVQYRCKLHRFMFGRVRVFGLALVAGGSSTMPGARARLDGRAAPGTGEVTIEQRGPDGAFTAVGAAHPGADGTFGAEVAPRAPSAFRARTGDLTSPEVRVAVAPRLTVRTQRHGRHIMVTVRAIPAQAGAPVALQRYRRERFDFRTVARRELGRGSSATFELRSSHWERFRVALVRGVGGYGSARSRPVAVPVNRTRGHGAGGGHRAGGGHGAGGSR